MTDPAPTQPVKPLRQSRTIAGISITTLSTIVGEFLQTLEPLQGQHEIIAYAVTVLQCLGMGLALYARIDDHLKGRR